MIKDRILITGGAGYIGSVISQRLLSCGYSVVVLDPLWFNKDIPALFSKNPNYKFIKGSILNNKLLDDVMKLGIDYVVHLAAVVGDPASKKFPQLTEEVNYKGAVSVISKSLNYGLKGFVFFSTCSNYGISDGLAKENSPVKPLSLYAKTKVDVENYLMDKAKPLNWVICRLSTVHGISPRMRFDLTVNDFAMNAYTKKYIDIFLPLSYRPYIHVSDVAKVIEQIIERFNDFSGEVFNLGFNGENYQKIKIAETVRRFIPELKIEIIKDGCDLRDYKVDFSKLQKKLNFGNDYTVEKSIAEIIGLFKNGRINDFQKSIYYNTFPDLDS